MKNVVKKATSFMLLGALIIGSTAMSYANEEINNEEIVIAHDGIPVIVSTEHTIDPMVDNAHINLTRSGIIINSSHVERQTVSGQFRAHGSANAHSHSGSFLISAQIWSGGVRHARGEGGARSGQTAVATSTLTSIAGTARLLFETHPDFGW
ncbi:MAG: hypothetical protein FWF57_03170 [Defluviitaleaceae bacterium]|nr:hypothetical protein [Defluviitaleaceae bacterium]